MLRLSNRDVPERDRLSYLHDFVASSVAGLQFTPREPQDFEFEVACRRLDGDVIVGSARYSSLRGERTRKLTADGRQNYMLTIHESDYEVTVGSRELKVARGDIVVVSETLHQSFMLPQTRLHAIVLNRRQMLDIVPAIDRQPIHHVPVSASGATLLSGYARLLLEGPILDDAGSRLVAGQLHHLAALALQGKATSTTDLSGIGSARLALVREFMARNLTDPDLDIAAVARRQGVSPRYVQQLFEREGTTFSQFLRDSRLDLARSAIEAADGRTIAAIAFDCGFGDLSHFNKAFRQRFGRTPRDVKAAVLRAMQ